MKTPAFALDCVAKQIARTRAGISKSFFMVNLSLLNARPGVKLQIFDRLRTILE
jgi:hypothetical protein